MKSESLPLPVSCFEHYFLADDRPDYPMTLWVYLEFSGKFQQEHFKTAFKQAIKLHPRFKATIPGDVGEKTSKLQWVASNSSEPHLNWDREEAPLSFPRGLRINLHEETGIRVFIREGSERTKLYFQVHHSCCDGLGMVQFLKDFFVFYEEADGSFQREGSLKSSPELNLTIPLKKEALWKKVLWLIPKDAYTSLSFLLRPVQPLAVPDSLKSRPEDMVTNPSYQSFSFTSEETRRLIQGAARQSATANDLLLRDLFLALRDWNIRYHSSPGRAAIRVMQPINLRISVNGSFEAKNEVSMVAFEALPRHFASRQFLLKKILKKSRKIKTLDGVITLMPKFLRQMGRIKGGMSSLLNEGRYFASTVLSFLPLDSLLAFSNLPLEDGRIVFGNMRLEKIIGFPPIRKTTPAVFSATVYAKELSIFIHYDPRAYTPAQAKEMLDGFVGQLKISIDSPT